MLADKVWLPVCVPVHPIGVGLGVDVSAHCRPVLGKLFPFWTWPCALGQRESCWNRKGPKHSYCCKVGNTLLGGLLVSQRMSDMCCSRGRMEWLGSGGALLNFVECTLYTEADFEYGREGSSTSLIPQGWQINYFFSQVIISGWVIYGFCNSSVTWPQGSQMPLRALAAVSTLRYFFPHICLKCQGDAFIFRWESCLISLLPPGVLIYHMDLFCLWVYVATLSVYLDLSLYCPETGLLLVPICV